MKSLQAIAGLTLPWMLGRVGPSHLVFCNPGVGKSKDNLNGLVAQLLEQTKPGAVRFLFIDEASQSGSFGAFNDLRDASKEVMGDAIATNKEVIRIRLAELVDAISLIKQDKLRQNHRSLDEYNESIRRNSGAAGEPYRYVVVSDWPHGFDEDSCRSLMKIMETGAVCGVYVLASWDTSAKAPYPFEGSPAEVWKHASWVDAGRNPVRTNMFSEHVKAVLQVDSGSAPLRNIVTRHAEGLKGAKGAIYPYERMREAIFASNTEPFKAINGFWEGNSAGGLVLPIGLAAGARIESVEIGRSGGSDAHHLLVVGPAGKGKSNLLHVMTQSLADMYSPNEVALYLVDLNGVAFERYARHRLPHARVVAAHGDPAFGIAVLEGVKNLLNTRMAMFKSAGVEQFQEYRLHTKKRLDRVIVVIDEFQNLLKGVTQEVAQELLKSLAREGRKFGVHMILATQTLKGFDFPRDVLDQIAIRIVLGGGRDDYQSILADDNRAAGSVEELHALVNADRGEKSGNRILQVALAFEKDAAVNEIDRLTRNWPGLARATGADEQLDFHLFDGDEPASLAESRAFNRILAARPTSDVRPPLELLLGDPLALSDSCKFTLRRDSGNNVLLLANRVEEIAGSMISMLLSVVAQQGPNNLYVSIVDMLGDEQSDGVLRSQFNALASAFSSMVKVFSRPSDEEFSDLLRLLECLIKQKNRNRSQLLVLVGIHKLLVLTNDDHAKGALTAILDQGPDAGVHTICWSNTLKNIKRTLDSDEAFGFGAVGAIARDDAFTLFDHAVSNSENRLNIFDRIEQNAKGMTVRPFATLATHDFNSLVARIRARLGKESPK